MREMSRSLPGLGLILGAALGFGFGLILDQGSAAIAGGIGAGLGLIVGAAVASFERAGQGT